MPRKDITLKLPHARSYRPDLPLWSQSGPDRLPPLTKAEKQYYADHPLVLEPCPMSQTMRAEGQKRMSGPKAISRARAKFVQLNILDLSGYDVPAVEVPA